MPQANTIETILDRYIPIPESGCWLWEGEVNHKGYGLISVKGKYYLAHRLSYQLSKGNIPANHHVCHTCDVRCCINPHHLFAGTSRENVYDALRKGRMQKLTVEQVKEIRRLRIQEGLVETEIAALFGVARGTIADILHYRTWKI